MNRTDIINVTILCAIIGVALATIAIDSPDEANPTPAPPAQASASDAEHRDRAPQPAPR